MFPTRREKRFWYRRIRETLFFLSILFGDCSPSPSGRESKELARAEGIDAILWSMFRRVCVRSTFPMEEKY